MTSLKSAQRGMGFFGAMLLIAVAAFFLTLLFKMGPSYMTYWQVRSAMDKLLEQPALVKEGPRGIITALGKQLYINEVRSVSQDKFSVAQTKDGRGLEVVVDYTAEEHIGFNVDALMTFHYSVVLPKNPS